MSNKLKEIKHVIKAADVRDPRAALFAIEQIISRKDEKPAKSKSTIRLDLVATKTGSAVRIKFDRNTLSARHIISAKQALDEFAADSKLSCDGNCEGCEDAGTTDLSELFKKFEAELKGGLQ